MEELLFIINPVADSGRAKDIKEVIEEEMKNYPRAYRIVYTKEEKEATKLAYESKANIVVAVGGDGTVTEVAKGILERGYGSLGIIPGGTGNDFTKSLGMEKNHPLAIKTIIAGKTMCIDVGLVNGRRFLNIGGVGLDVAVLRSFEKIKKYVRGNFAYIISVFITLLKYKKIKATIEMDGKKEEKDLVLFGAGNGKFFGGGLQMIPHAVMDDGYLHSTLVKNISNWRIATIFPEIFKGTHVRHKKYVETFKTKEIKIITQEDLYINLDGEIFFGGKEINFSISDEKLELIVP